MLTEFLAECSRAKCAPSTTPHTCQYVDSADMCVPDGAIIISGAISDINSEHAACKQNSLVRTQLPKLKKRIVLQWKTTEHLVSV